MALVDSYGKICYWDEVNWHWLPHIYVRNKRVIFRKGNTEKVVDKKTALDLVGRVYSLRPLTEISMNGSSVFEISKKVFLVNGKIIRAGSPISLYQKIADYDVISAFSSHKAGYKSQLDFILHFKSKGGMKEVVYNGKKYLSHRELAMSLGIDYKLFMSRMKKWGSIEKSLLFDRSPQDHLGNEFKNVEEMCKYWGINKNTYKGRLKRGWTLKETLEVPPKIRKG